MNETKSTNVQEWMKLKTMMLWNVVTATDADGYNYNTYAGAESRHSTKQVLKLLQR